VQAVSGTTIVTCTATNKYGAKNTTTLTIALVLLQLLFQTKNGIRLAIPYSFKTADSGDEPITITNSGDPIFLVLISQLQDNYKAVTTAQGRIWLSSIKVSDLKCIHSYLLPDNSFTYPDNDNIKLQL